MLETEEEKIDENGLCGKIGEQILRLLGVPPKTKPGTHKASKETNISQVIKILVVGPG